MLVGEGAQQFAVQQGFPLAPDELSPTAQQAYQEWLKEARYQPVINVEKRADSGNKPYCPPDQTQGRIAKSRHHWHRGPGYAREPIGHVHD